jgi:hypothetical protein
MTITKINYCSWEGTPAVSAYYPDGRILAYEYNDDKWVQVHEADVSTKAVLIGEAAFKKRWPDLVLPAFPE